MFNRDMLLEQLADILGDLPVLQPGVCDEKVQSCTDLALT